MFEARTSPVPVEFDAFTDIALHDAALAHVRPGLRDFFRRHALEAAWLRGQGVAYWPAHIAAARAAALFITGEHDRLSPEDILHLPGWVGPMAGEVAVAQAALAGFFPQAQAAEVTLIRNQWGRLGTAEEIMETGGDIRLAREPGTGLNGYGCSHRPRPWAITFASSTASSCSERGYAAADRARLYVTSAILQGRSNQAVGAVLAEVRTFLAEYFCLDDNSAVVLAASGTDTELLALALAQCAAPEHPVLVILVAPEETGSGVPMAACGLHFAVDTAGGHDVDRSAPIEGFQPDIILETVRLRDSNAVIRPDGDVMCEIEAKIAAGLETGRRVVLHALDLSKTGLLAPGLGGLRQLRAQHGAAQFDIVVDACQARLSPQSVQAYLALDAIVLVTGSKFFTGPPFAGALLLPPAIADRLNSGLLPAGLDAYFGRYEFPAGCAAAACLPETGNYGLALRWHAAMAEMRALAAVDGATRKTILDQFSSVVAEQIAADPALHLLPARAIVRMENDEVWERCCSIFSFSLADPNAPNASLDPDSARRVYQWLNTDLSGILSDLVEEETKIALRICHIGQPVKLPNGDGGAFGVLRVAAGARLITGEPSHDGLSSERRLTREFDDLRLVFAKIRLILQHYNRLNAANPSPRYRVIR